MARQRTADLQKYVVPSGGTIRDVVENLNKSMLRIAFVAQDDRVVGSISDGDLRRAFLSGITLQSPLVEVMNTSFISARPDSTPSELQRLFRRGIDIVPVLDQEGRLVDVRRQGGQSTVIPVAEPSLTHYERDLALEAIDSGWISSVGRFVNDFEGEFAEYVGAADAVSVNNGTAALALAMWTLGVGPGDEVIVPDLTFGATANAVIQSGATPVLVDVAPGSWALNPKNLAPALTPRTRAIIVVHLYGIPAPLDAIFEFATKHDLLVIEDCAEAIGTRLGDQHVGSESDAGTFSFFGNKTITTGEGGMVTFRSQDHGRRARTIRSHGMSSNRRYWHDEWGTNLRLTNIQAALGLGQLRRIEAILERKRAIAERYAIQLTGMSNEGLEFPPEPPEGFTTFWLYTVLLPAGVDPKNLGQEMLRQGIETRPVFYPLHQQPAFSSFAQDHETYDYSNAIASRGLSLPSSVNLTDDAIDLVAQTLRTAVKGVSSS